MRRSATRRVPAQPREASTCGTHDPRWDRQRPLPIKYRLTEWIRFKERLCARKVRPVTMSAVITGEQMTRQTLTFTTSSLGGFVDLLHDIRVKSCVQFDHVSLCANADKNVGRKKKRAQSSVRQRARPCLWPLSSHTPPITLVGEGASDAVRSAQMHTHVPYERPRVSAPRFTLPLRF